MQIQDLLKAGRLPEALAAAEDQARGEPASAKHRALLFQLLCVMGQWERAATQLTVAGELDKSFLLTAQIYQRAILCERLRAQVFAGGRAPLVLGEPEAWVGWMIRAAALYAQGKHSESAELRTRALAAAPVVGGEIAGTRFEWLGDGDARLGPILEVMAEGKYYWAPLSRVSELRVERPQDLRDFVWIPAHVLWATGGEQEIFIPTRYPGSESAADGLLRLGRRTEWADVKGGEGLIGLGQRMFVTDAGEFALLESGTVKFDRPAGGGG